MGRKRRTATNGGSKMEKARENGHPKCLRGKERRHNKERKREREETEATNSLARQCISGRRKLG